jgi:hypothetical protein
MRIKCAGWMLAASVFPSTLAMAQVGVFQGHGDIGTVLHAGSAQYDAAKKSYRVTASGGNMWGTSDAFHFVWLKASGDLSIAADISFATTSGNAHKKAVQIIRQSLDAGSAYADAALHASGLTSLQARDEQGGATHEIQSNANGPKRLKLTKRGGRFHISVAGEALRLAGGSMKVPMKGEFYIGIGVTAHDKDAIETAMFSKVEMTPEPAATGQPKLFSPLETITVASTDRRAVYTAPGRFEAPNWSSDNMLYHNGGGQPVLIDTGIATRLNNDHAISPGGKSLAFVSYQLLP